MSFIEELHTSFRQKKANVQPIVIWVVNSIDSWEAIDRYDNPPDYQCQYGNKKETKQKLSNWEWQKKHGEDMPRNDWTPQKYAVRKCLAIQMDGRRNELRYTQYDKEYANMDVKIIRGIATGKAHTLSYSNMAQYVCKTKTEAHTLKKALEIRWLKDKLEKLKKDMKCRDGKRIHLLDQAKNLEVRVIPAFEKEVDRVTRLLEKA